MSFTSPVGGAEETLSYYIRAYNLATPVFRDFQAQVAATTKAVQLQIAEMNKAIASSSLEATRAASATRELASGGQMAAGAADAHSVSADSTTAGLLEQERAIRSAEAARRDMSTGIIGATSVLDQHGTSVANLGGQLASQTAETKLATAANDPYLLSMDKMRVSMDSLTKESQVQRAELELHRKALTDAATATDNLASSASKGGAAVRIVGTDAAATDTLLKAHGNEIEAVAQLYNPWMRQMGMAGQGLDALGRHIDLLKSQHIDYLAAGVSAASIGVIGYGAHVADTFDTLGKSIQQQAGTSPAQTNQLVADVQQVSKSVPDSFQQIGNAVAAEYKLLGDNDEQIKKNTADYLAFANAAGGNVTTSIQQVTAIMRQFHPAGMDTTDVMNQLVTLAQDTQQPLSQYLDIFSRLGPQLSATGLSFKGVVGMFDEFSKKGASASEISLGFSKALSWAETETGESGTGSGAAANRLETLKASVLNATNTLNEVRQKLGDSSSYTSTDSAANQVKAHDYSVEYDKDAAAVAKAKQALDQFQGSAAANIKLHESTSQVLKGEMQAIEDAKTKQDALNISTQVFGSHLGPTMADTLFRNKDGFEKMDAALGITNDATNQLAQSQAGDLHAQLQITEHDFALLANTVGGLMLPAIEALAGGILKVAQAAEGLPKPLLDALTLGSLSVGAGLLLTRHSPLGTVISDALGKGEGGGPLRLRTLISGKQPEGVTGHESLEAMDNAATALTDSAGSMDTAADRLVAAATAITEAAEAIHGGGIGGGLGGGGNLVSYRGSTTMVGLLSNPLAVTMGTAATSAAQTADDAADESGSAADDPYPLTRGTTDEANGAADAVAPVEATAARGESSTLSTAAKETIEVERSPLTAPMGVVREVAPEAGDGSGAASDLVSTLSGEANVEGGAQAERYPMTDFTAQATSTEALEGELRARGAALPPKLTDEGYGYDLQQGLVASKARMLTEPETPTVVGQRGTSMPYLPMTPTESETAEAATRRTAPLAADLAKGVTSEAPAWEKMAEDVAPVATLGEVGLLSKLTGGLTGGVKGFGSGLKEGASSLFSEGAGGFIGKLGMGAMVGTLGMTGSDLIGNMVGGKTGKDISKIGSDASVGAGVGMMIGPEGAALGALGGAAVGAITSIFDKKGPDVGKQLADSLGKGFDPEFKDKAGETIASMGTQIAKLADDAKKQGQTSQDKPAAPLMVHNQEIAPGQEANAVAEADAAAGAKRADDMRKLGGLAGQEFVTEFSNVPYPSEYVMLTDFKKKIDGLQPYAQQSAGKTIEQFAAGLVAQGKMPQAALNQMITQMDASVGGLNEYMHQAGEGTDKGLAAGLTMTKSEATLKDAVARMRTDFGGGFDNIAKTTGKDLVSNFTTAENDLQQVIDTGTKGARAKALVQLTNMKQDQATALSSMVKIADSQMQAVADKVQGGSGSAAQAVYSGFENISENINASMAAGVTSASQGAADIAKALQSAMKAFGSKGAPMQLEMQQFNATHANMQVNSLGQLHVGTAASGYIGTPGTVGPDNVLIHAAEGEAILNGPQQDIVNSFVPGGLPGVFAGTAGSKHYASMPARPVPSIADGMQNVQGFAGGGVVLDSGVNMTVNQEPRILSDLRQFSNEMGETVYVISGYRSPQHSVEVGGFADDPHTRGEAADIGLGAPTLASMYEVAESKLRAVGLFRPFYPPDDAEANHVQLISGGVSGQGGGAAATVGQVTGGAGSSTARVVVPKISMPKVVGTGVLADLVRAGLMKATEQANDDLTKAASANSGGTSNGSFTGLSGDLTSEVNQISKQENWGPGQVTDWLKVIMKESGGSMTAKNPTSDAYGIAQGIDGPSWYAQYGGNVNTMSGQLTAMANYIKGRYGDPAGAWQHELTDNWYASGGVVDGPANVQRDKFLNAGAFAGGGHFTASSPTVALFGDNGEEDVYAIPKQSVTVQRDNITAVIRPDEKTNPISGAASLADAAAAKATATADAATAAKTEAAAEKKAAAAAKTAADKREAAYKAETITETLTLGKTDVGSFQMTRSAASKAGLPAGKGSDHTVSISDLGSLSDAGFAKLLAGVKAAVANDTSDRKVTQLAGHYTADIFGAANADQRRATGYQNKAGDIANADPKAAARDRALALDYQRRAAVAGEKVANSRSGQLDATLIASAAKATATQITATTNALTKSQSSQSLIAGMPTGTNLGSFSNAELKSVGVTRGQADAMVGGNDPRTLYAVQEKGLNTAISQYQTEAAQTTADYKDALKDHNKKLATAMQTQLNTITQAQLQAQSDLTTDMDTMIQSIYTTATTKAQRQQSGSDLVSSLAALPSGGIGSLKLSPKELTAVAHATGTSASVLRSATTDSVSRIAAQHAPITSADMAKAQTGVTDQNKLYTAQMGTDRAALAKLTSELDATGKNALKGTARTDAQQEVAELASSMTGLQSSIDASKTSMDQLVQAQESQVEATVSSQQAGLNNFAAITNLQPGTDLTSQLGNSPFVAALQGSEGTSVSAVESQGLTAGNMAAARASNDTTNSNIQAQIGTYQAAMAQMQAELPTLSGSALTDAQNNITTLAGNILTLDGTIQTNNAAVAQLSTDYTNQQVGNQSNAGSVMSFIQGLAPGTDLSSLGLTPAVLAGLDSAAGLPAGTVEGATEGTGVSYLTSVLQNGGSVSQAQLAGATSAVGQDNQVDETSIGLLTAQIGKDETDPEDNGAGAQGSQTQSDAIYKLLTAIMGLKGNIQDNTDGLTQLTTAVDGNTQATTNNTGSMTGTTSFSYNGQNGYLASDQPINVGVGL